MNMQNILVQLMKSSNPIQMLMNTLNPNQTQAVNNFKSMTSNEQAEKIAQLANEKGLSKEDLQKIINMMRK